MGKKRNTKKSYRARAPTKKNKKVTKIEPTKNLIKKLKITSKENQPVKLTEEYRNLFGNNYPQSHEDINDFIDILLIQYNRITKSQQPDKNIIHNIKSCCKTLTKIIVHYTDDKELKQLLKVIELADDANDSNIGFIKKELDAIYSQIRSNESRYYLRLLSRMQNKLVQSKYLNSMRSDKDTLETNLEEEHSDDKKSDDEINDILIRVSFININSN